MTTNSDRAPTTSGAAHAHGYVRSKPLKYVPGFLYILILYVVGSFIVPDPRANWSLWDGYHLSWVEFLLVAAAMMAIAEQLKVSHPGIDNTVEAIFMAAIAGLQVLLFALGVAGVRYLGIFDNTEFLLLTLISLTQAVVGLLINARTMRRTIDVSPG
jgi:hypothetical protein